MKAVPPDDASVKSLMLSAGARIWRNEQRAPSLCVNPGASRYRSRAGKRKKSSCRKTRGRKGYGGNGGILSIRERESHDHVKKQEVNSVNPSASSCHSSCPPPGPTN